MTAARIRTLFADDEPMARASLRALLAVDPEIEIVAECKNGDEALERMRELGPELALLDVEMPGRTGLEVVEALAPDERPVVVFATAYDHFAVRAFDVHAVDYVLKPFDDARFEAALGRAKTRVREASALDAAGGLTGLLQELEGRGEYPRRISIHKEGRVELVDIDEIRWIEAADQYVCLHTDGGECLMRESMGRLEQALDPERFLRVHRSAIVALDRVRTLESAASGNARLQLTSGDWLPVSRSRVSSVRKRLG